MNRSLRAAGLEPLWDTVIKLVRAFLNLRESYNEHMLSLYLVYSRLLQISAADHKQSSSIFQPILYFLLYYIYV